MNESLEEKQKFGREVRRQEFKKEIISEDSSIESSSSSALNPTPSQCDSEKTKLFDAAVGVAPHGPKLLSPFLDAKSTLNISRLNHNYKKLYYDPNSIKEKLLVERFGPKTEALTSATQTTQEAFQTHCLALQVVKEIPITSSDELSERMTQYSVYHLSNLITEQEFKSLFIDTIRPNSNEELPLILFLDAHPNFQDSIFSYILNNLSADNFILLLADQNRFIKILNKYPKYKNQLIERACSRRTCLSVSNIDSFMPDPANTFLEEMLKTGLDFISIDEETTGHLKWIEIIKTFPENAGQFVEAFVTSHSSLSKLFQAERYTKDFCNQLPQYKEVILKIYHNFKSLDWGRPASIITFLTKENLLKQLRRPLVIQSPFPSFRNFRPKYQQTLAEMLDAKSTLALSLTNKEHKALYSESLPFKFVTEQIGPSFSDLMKHEKSPKQAYQTHKSVLEEIRIGSVKYCLEDLSYILNIFPEYYLHNLITEINFRHLFVNEYSITVLTEYLLANPQFQDRIFFYITNHLSTSSFFDLLASREKLIKILYNFPDYGHVILKRAFRKTLCVRTIDSIDGLKYTFLEVVLRDHMLPLDKNYYGLYSLKQIINRCPRFKKLFLKRIIIDEYLFSQVFFDASKVLELLAGPQYTKILNTLFQNVVKERPHHSDDRANSLQYFQAVIEIMPEFDAIPDDQKYKIKAESKEGQFNTCEFNDFPTFTPQELLLNSRLKPEQKDNQEEHDHEKYTQLLKEEIGDPKFLIAEGESAHDAYYRHRKITRDLQLRDAHDDRTLGIRLNQYPHYSIHSMFPTFLPFSYDLVNLRRHKPFSNLAKLIKEHPDHEKRIIDFAFSNKGNNSSSLITEQEFMDFAKHLGSKPFSSLSHQFSVSFFASASQQTPSESKTENNQATLEIQSHQNNNSALQTEIIDPMNHNPFL